MSRQQGKEERTFTKRGDVLKRSMPLTISRPELINDGSDRDLRRLADNLFAFTARPEAIRDGHARQIGLAGVEYTVLISIGFLEGCGKPL